MADRKRCEELTEIARRLRVEIVRMVHHAQSGHIGGGFSAADIVAALYWEILRIRPEEPDWPDRDRFVLSKGHACTVLYAALALRGYLPVEELKTLRCLNSRLQGHPVMGKPPGVEMTTGPLGEGLSTAVGMALGARHLGRDFRTFCMIGCGEMQEGQIWEAAMAAAHYKLNNLVAIVDYNRLQLDGFNDEVMGIAPVADKWRAFNWRVFELDGHDMAQILDTLQAAIEHQNGPAVLVAHTIKGKGVSYMENVCEWHGKAPNDEQFAQAMRELGEMA